MAERNHLFEYQRENFMVDNRSICQICKMGFYDNLNQIVFMYPNQVFHYECYTANDPVVIN
jgi:hypothetical protein